MASAGSIQMTSHGSVQCSTEVPFSSVRLDINFGPSTAKETTCCATVREERTKLREESDALYNDYKVLDQQNQILTERNNALECRCEKAEAIAGDWRKGLAYLQESISGLVDSGLKNVSTETQTDHVSDSKMVQTEAGKSPSHSEMSETVAGDTITNLQAENSRLRAQFQQAIMLAALWEKRWRSSEDKKQIAEQRLATLTEDYLDEEMEWNWNAEKEDEKEKNGGPIFSRFRQEVCQMRECQNCRRFFGEDEAGRDLCLFHPQRPLSMAEWLTLFPDADHETIALDKEDYKYWLCCDKFDRKCPRGCTVGHHVLKANVEREL